MTSNQHIPSAPHFKDVIHSIWQTKGLTRFHNEHILPKGIVEIIFNFSDGLPMTGNVGTNSFHLPGYFINGFNRTPINLVLPEHLQFFGVQLQPLAVKKILGIPACEFTDSIIDLCLVDAAFHSLWHQLAEQTDFEKRVAIFSAWLEKKLPGSQPQEKMVNDFLYGINKHDLSVKELAQTLCYSSRQLSRKMAEATGMNTEEILLYKKYLHAVHLIHHTDLSLTKIAYESNFCDQSHFIKSFKAYTNMTPGEYKAGKGFMKGHLYENVR